MDVAPQRPAQTLGRPLSPHLACQATAPLCRERSGLTRRIPLRPLAFRPCPPTSGHTMALHILSWAWAGGTPTPSSITGLPSGSPGVLVSISFP